MERCSLRGSHKVWRINFYGQFIKFIDIVINTLWRIIRQKDIKTKLVEKKIIVEVEDKDSAVKLCKAGVDGLQFDKVEPKELKEIVNELKQINPKILLIGTGGITSTNVKEYAKTGIDAVSTTSVYFGKPCDIGVTITEN